MTFQTVEQLQAQITGLTAENERLRALVKAGYEEGYKEAFEGWPSTFAEVCSRSWWPSETRAALNPQEPPK